MTAIYAIPKTISPRFRFRSKPVNARAIHVVVPTFKDWDGLRTTLDSLAALKTPPKQISVANDNPDNSVPEWLHDYGVNLVSYPGNLGPAAARNRGFGIDENLPFQKLLRPLATALETGSDLPGYLRNGLHPDLSYVQGKHSPKAFRWDADFDWVYFTDCGCTHHPDIFLKFEETWKERGDCCAAISGPVTGSGSGPINDYMTEQGILNPPMERDLHGVYIPQAIDCCTPVRIFRWV